MGDLLHWKRTGIRVFISSLIPSTVINFQHLPGQLTRAQTLITPFVFLSPIEEPSAGDWEALNTCGPPIHPVLQRELPGLSERRTRLTGGWTRGSLIPTIGSERHAPSCRSGPASGPTQQGPPAAAHPGRHNGASPGLHRAPRALCSAAASAAPTGCSREGEAVGRHRPGGHCTARRPRAPWGRGGPRPGRPAVP